LVSFLLNQSFLNIARILHNVNTFYIFLMKINLISPEVNEFTKILTSIPNKPQALYYSGTLPQKRQKSVAIVGSRKPTAYGKEVAANLARDLAQRDIIIISGLALGIDSVAHKAALDVGGLTIAVMGNGLHKIYPHTNRALGERILASDGAILTEYESGQEPLPHHFLARNRIVSGLSDAIVIVEAAKRSGTLNTAMHALEQGREVFAVPGNITSPLSAGCNALLKQGAPPVTCAQDILDVIAPGSSLDHNQQNQLPIATTPLESKIIELTQSGTRDGEELQSLSGVSASELNSALTMLEINGAITSLGANKWRL
jgi:DNA processing protein